MSNRRGEYEMLFRLGAQMSGSFGGTFKKAQQTIEATQKEISALNKIQGDINAYQKAQREIEKTSSKLESLKKQYALIEQQEKEEGQASAALEREKLKLGDRIKDLTGKLENEKSKLESTKQRLQEAGVDTKNLGTESEKLKTRIDELRKELEKAAGGAQDFGQRASQAIQGVGSVIAAAGIAKGLMEIYEGFKACSDIAADFEATMSTVEALSGAGADEMTVLNEKAKELGATTAFTATEAAQAMTYMGMAGWSASDMLDGMNGVMNLAAASGEDLALVSDIVTDNLTAFGLSAKDTARFSDVLAGAATNSNTSVAVMGETFKNAASIAGALRYSIEDVSVAVGLMANSGVKGSIAGTALKNTFNGLIHGATLAGKAFGEYEFSAVKADGTMKSFGSTLDELRMYFSQMTEAEKMANAQAIAGERGYNGLLAILNATDEEYQSLRKSISESAGAAERMSKIKLDNYKGQVTLMNSAFDALKTSIGEDINPMLREGAELATGFLNVGNEFVKANPGIVKAGAVATGVIGAVTAGVTGYVAVMGVAKVVTAAVGATFLSTLGPIAAVTAGVAVLAGGIVALVSEYNEGVDSVKDLTESTRGMDSAFQNITGTFEETEQQTAATVQLAGQYLDRLDELEKQGLDNKEAQDEYNLTVDKFNSLMPEANVLIDENTGLVKDGTAAVRQYVDEWEKAALEEAKQKKYNAELEAWADAQLEVAANEQKLTDNLVKKEQLQNKLSESTRKYNALSKERQALEKSDPGYNEKYWDLTNAMESATYEIDQAQAALSKTDREIANLNSAIDQGSAALEGYEAEVEEARRLMEEASGATGEYAEELQPLVSVMESVTSEMEALAASYQEAYNSAYESINGQYALWDQAAAIIPVSIGSINSALESQTAYWNEYQSNLAALTAKTGEIEGLSEVIAGFADGSEESVNAIAGMAKASDAELQKMVENYHEVKQAQDEAAQELADLTTEYTSKMDDLVNAIGDDVAALDMSDEAREQGKATIEGYIKGASSSEVLSRVQQAYARVVETAKTALGGGTGTVPVFKSAKGHAKGTSYASPGVAWVGEEGPELMRFRGGEQVVNAKDSAAIANRTSTMTVSAPVTFHIEGNATESTIEALRDYGEEFTRRVLDVIENAGTDARRRAYA